MRRREFIALLCGCGIAAAWPAASRAEDKGRVARVGCLTLLSKDDPMSEFWDAEFRKRLNGLGWIEGRNIDIQWRCADAQSEDGKGARDIISASASCHRGRCDRIIP
jgi:hypothetical protein